MASIRGFYTRLLEDVSQVPGVSAVGASTNLPLGVRERRAFTFEQEPPAGRDLPHSVTHEWVAGCYFEAIGISLRRGRYFTPSDAADSEPVTIITIPHTPWVQVSDSMIAENVLGLFRSLRGALHGEVEPAALAETIVAHRVCGADLARDTS